MLSSCWYYSTSDSLPPYLKSIYIEPVTNKTAQYNLEESMTNQITNAFIENGRLKVVNNREEADLLLQIEIIGYDDEPYTVSKDEEVSQYLLEITVNADCKNLKENTTLWGQNNFSQKEPYNHEVDESGLEAQSKTIKKLSEEIVSRILTVW